MNNKRIISYWNIAGLIATIIIGFLNHYIYKWSEKSSLVALIAPVNESVWEHLKLGLWAVILFSFIEYVFLRKIGSIVCYNINQERPENEYVQVRHQAILP